MKKERIIFIIGIITIIISSIISVYAASYLYNSNEVSYNNTSSGITSDNVQGAIDELYTEATNYNTLSAKVGSDTLTTTAQDLSGAVNELNSSLTNFVSTKNNITYTKKGNMRRMDCRWVTYGNIKSFYENLPSDDRTSNFYVGTFIITLSTFNYQRMAYVGTENTGNTLVGQLCTNYNYGTGTPSTIPDDQILMGSLIWYVEN